MERGLALESTLNSCGLVHSHPSTAFVPHAGSVILCLFTSNWLDNEMGVILCSELLCACVCSSLCRTDTKRMRLTSKAFASAFLDADRGVLSHDCEGRRRIIRMSWLDLNFTQGANLSLFGILLKDSAVPIHPTENNASCRMCLSPRLQREVLL